MLNASGDEEQFNMKCLSESGRVVSVVKLDFLKHVAKPHAPCIMVGLGWAAAVVAMLPTTCTPCCAVLFV